jgi:GDPmannose 4,6-dehydratase
VTRKITRAVAAIKSGRQKNLYVGNLDAIRDWGYAKEYVESMWLMLQQDSPEDYVIATGVGATVKDFCKVAFKEAGLDWEEYVIIDKNYYRPTEVNALVGDSRKAKQKLLWSAKTEWNDLAKLMVESDLRNNE